MSALQQFSQQLQRFPRDRHPGLTADAMMRHVCYALVPGVFLHACFFGVGVLIQLILALITALFCEGINALLRQRRLDRLAISAGGVTACLLAVSVPATAAWWVIVVAVAFGLLLGKHVFGGVGMNIFNPALVGFCAVYLSFSAEMSLYPQGLVSFSETVALIFSTLPSHALTDGLTGATQLAGLKANGVFANPTLSHWWVNVAWLAGGGYLWLRNLADWRLSATFVTVFVILTAGLAVFNDHQVISTTEHIGLGALVFTACFIITDPTTAATGTLGRIIYAALAATLAAIIRQYSNMPDSMAFAVLLANLSAPMIDHYTRPQYNSR